MKLRRRLRDSASLRLDELVAGRRAHHGDVDMADDLLVEDAPGSALEDQARRPDP